MQKHLPLGGKTREGHGLLTVDSFVQFVEAYHERLRALTDLLNVLDNRIGDGDHGTNMARGFDAAVKKLHQSSLGDLGMSCSTLAMTLISTVGGASGPLYGTAFLKLSTVWKGLKSVDGDSLRRGLTASLEGIQARGKAVPGDKTMVDVWYAMTSYLHQNDPFSSEVWNQAVETAQQAAVETKDKIAKKGRASYLGTRSVGVCDPGSVSSAVLFEELIHSFTGGALRLEWETLALY